MAHFQNKYGAAHSTDAYGNNIRKDEYGNVIPTDEYGDPIRHNDTTLQGGQQQQRHHDLSTEYDGQGGRRSKGLKEKITENIPGVGNNNYRNHTSSATTDAYGNVIRKDEYGNVIPTDEYGNPIRHNGTTLQGGQQQQRHDLSTEYDGQGGRRNKGLKEKITENIPGVGNNDYRNHASSATTDVYGNVIRKDEYGNVIPTDEYGNPIRHNGTTLQQGGQQQQRHDLSTEYDGQGGRRNKGLKEKITENIPGVGNNDYRNHTSSATTDEYGNVIRKDEYGNVIPTDEYGDPISHNDTTLQGGQQQQRHHGLSTEYDGQGGGRRNKGLKEKVTENIPGFGINDHRNDASSATTDAYGNVIRKDEYGNVIPTDEYGNPIRLSGTTHQGGRQQQQRHDLSTEYDGQGGRRNKGLKEKMTENIPGVGNNDYRNHTSSATTDGNVIPSDEYGNPIRHSGTTNQGGRQQQQQQRHDLPTEYDGQDGRRNKGLKEKTTENILGVGNNDHRNDTSSATTDANGNVIRKDEYGNVIPTNEHGNPIRHSGTTHQGGQQQQRHGLSTEYDGQGGRRNEGLKEKITENVPGVGNKDHRNDTSSAATTTHTTTAGGYGTEEQAQQQYHQHAEKKGMMGKIKEKLLCNPTL